MYEFTSPSPHCSYTNDTPQLRLLQDLHGSADHRRNKRRQEEAVDAGTGQEVLRYSFIHSLAGRKG